MTKLEALLKNAEADKSRERAAREFARANLQGKERHAFLLQSWHTYKCIRALYERKFTPYGTTDTLHSVQERRAAKLAWYDEHYPELRKAYEREKTDGKE